MFEIFAKLLSSIAAFLFPVFASYKALQTSDPAQLTPWLMYWVVLACALLIESWTGWLLVWIPFYAYIRLLFLLYLVLPQTQGACVIFQERIHPYLADNETSIENLIASTHDRLRAASIAYLKHAIDLLKTNVLGMPLSEEPALASSTPNTNNTTAQSYTQSLLARFTLPAARWAGTAGTKPTPSVSAEIGGEGSGVAADFYNLLASAVSAVTHGTTTLVAPGGPANAYNRSVQDSTLIPNTIHDVSARMSFITAQKERLNVLLSALDREATQLQSEERERIARASSLTLDGEGGLIKSRSEPDFEKLEAESGAEDDMQEAGLRRRTPGLGAAGSWFSWSGGSGEGK